MPVSVRTSPPPEQGEGVGQACAGGISVLASRRPANGADAAVARSPTLQGRWSGRHGMLLRSDWCCPISACPGENRFVWL